MLVNLSPKQICNMLSMISVTRADVEALELVVQRAKDDWDLYLESGHGPSDFGSDAEWGAHKKLHNSAFKTVEKLLDKARRTLALAEDFKQKGGAATELLMNLPRF